MDFYSDEEWLELRGTTRYLISTRGRIYNTARKHEMSSKVVRPNNRLRCQVSAPRAGSSKSVTVATEVLLAFGPEEGKRRKRPSDLPAHADGNVRNCKVSNLYWVGLNSPEHREANELIAAFERKNHALLLRETLEEVEEAAAPKGADAARRDLSARPGGIVTAAAVAAAQAGQRKVADLTADEKRQVREWWIERGGSARGRISADALMAYDHERATA